jgi:signal transduction histidine kinase
MKLSLRGALGGLWAVIAALCLSLALLMHELFEQGVGAQLSQANQRLERASEGAVRRFERYRATYKPQEFSPNDASTRNDLTLLVGAALAIYPGVEGGIWQGENESLAYAFPTHEGGSEKRDLPAAELPQIREIIRASQKQRMPIARRFDGERASLMIQAQPLPGPPDGMTLWVMTRAPLEVGRSYQQFGFGLGALLLLGLGSGFVVLLLLRRWARSVSELERAIVSTALEDLPVLRETGERELDRIVLALNQLNARLKSMQADRAQLSRDLARADRLAALGRMAAGLTHEIGNPLAAMRLRAENGLASDHERSVSALRAILVQIGRLEELLSALRLLTRAGEIRPRAVPLGPFLRAQVESVQPAAAKTGIELAIQPPPKEGEEWIFDEKSVSRAVENLLLNAIQHTPAGGRITLASAVTDDRWRLTISDTGPGIAAADAERVFEAFVTSRADGMGLGLSLVREIVEAHGGSVTCRAKDAASETSGGVFVLEIPKAANRNK